MPYLRLEYSANILEEIDPEELFSPCHRILADTIKADLFCCQSRLVPCDLYHIGEGLPQEAFIFLEILILEGRSLTQVQEAGERILKALEKYFSRSLKELNIQIGVRFAEFASSHYFKTASRK